MIKRSTALALLAAIALLGAGCGKDSEKGAPIPRPIASELEKQLASIQRRFEFGDGACTDITSDNEPAVARLVDQIPSSVDPEVRDAVRESFDHLFELTATQCDETKGQDTTPTETDTTPTQPPDTQTQETDTQTDTQQTDTQPQTGTQQQPPGQQKKPKKQNNGNGGGPAAPGGAGD